MWVWRGESEGCRSRGSLLNVLVPAVPQPRGTGGRSGGSYSGLWKELAKHLMKKASWNEYIFWWNLNTPGISYPCHVLSEASWNLQLCESSFNLLFFGLFATHDLYTCAGSLYKFLKKCKIPLHFIHESTNLLWIQISLCIWDYFRVSVWPEWDIPVWNSFQCIHSIHPLQSSMI